jgi:hypothetical protein
LRRRPELSSTSHRRAGELELTATERRAQTAPGKSSSGGRPSTTRNWIPSFSARVNLHRRTQVPETV